MAFSLIDSLARRFYHKKAWVLVGGAIAGGISLVACSSVAPTYYTLTREEGASYPVSSNSVQVIKVLTPSVSEQLDRDTMVFSGQSYRMIVDDKAAWSEPLGTLIGHTLAGDLAQRLPGRVVFSQNDSVEASPQAYIALSVSHFDMNATNYVTIEGILSVRKVDGGAAQSFPVHWISPQPVVQHSQAFAEALSKGVGAIADQAARSVSGMSVH